MVYLPQYTVKLSGIGSSSLLSTVYYYTEYRDIEGNCQSIGLTHSQMFEKKLRIQWYKRVTNRAVLERAGIERSQHSLVMGGSVGLVMWSGCLGNYSCYLRNSRSESRQALKTVSRNLTNLLVANVREEGYVQHGPIVYSMTSEMLRDSPNLSVPLTTDRKEWRRLTPLGVRIPKPGHSRMIEDTGIRVSTVEKLAADLVQLFSHSNSNVDMAFVNLPLFAFLLFTLIVAGNESAFAPTAVPECSPSVPETIISPTVPEASSRKVLPKASSPTELPEASSSTTVISDPLIVSSEKIMFEKKLRIQWYKRVTNRAVLEKAGIEPLSAFIATTRVTFVILAPRAGKLLKTVSRNLTNLLVANVRDEGYAQHDPICVLNDFRDATGQSQSLRAVNDRQKGVATADSVKSEDTGIRPLKND
eukprot:sb/3465087/